MSRYELGGVIGQGGFGEVVEAVRVKDRSLWAIKTLTARGDEELKRFQREVRMQAQLRHRHIVPIIEYNLEDDPPWFVMPRARCNMREHCSGRKGEGEIWIVRQVAEGLAHAHDNGVIHRDLKPENILLFDDEEGTYAAVSDFGLGRFFSRDSPSLTSTNIALGTMEYMAPEQYADAKHVDLRSDVYSLGKILYEILVGEVPFPLMDYSNVPRKFAYVIQKACQDDCDKRYHNIAGLVRDLDTAIQKERLLTRPAGLVRDQVQELMERDEFSPTGVERLGRMLLENTDDNTVLTDILPRIPDPLLERLIQDQMPTMTPVLQAYDEAVSGGLPFDYCDTVAYFYEKVFWWTDSDDARVMILRRLPRMGYDHNRWRVRTVFARIVSELDDPSLVLAVRDVLDSDASMAKWCKPALDLHSLPSCIIEVLNS